MVILNVTNLPGSEIGFSERGTSLAAQERAMKAEENRKSGLAALYVGPGALLGAADTVGQSLGLLEADTITQNLAAFDKKVGTMGFAETYSDNRTGYRMIGDVATSVAIGGGVGAAMRAPMMVKATTALTKVAPKTGTVAQRLLVSDHSRVTRGVQQYARQANLFGKKTMSNAFSETTQARELARSIRLQNLKNVGKEAVITEGAIVGFQSESELLFPEGVTLKDTAINLGLGLGAAGAIGNLMLNPAMKRAAGFSGRGAAKEGRTYSGSPGYDMVTGLFFVDEIAARRLDGEFRGITDGDQIEGLSNTGRSRFNSAADTLADATPVEGVSVKMKLTPGQRRNLEGFTRDNPRAATAALSVEQGDAGYAFSAQVQKQIEKNFVEIKKNEATMRAISKNDAEWYVLAQKNRGLEEANNFLRDEVWATRVNRLGISSGNLDDRTVFDEPGVRNQLQKTTEDVRSQDHVSMVYSSDKRPMGFSAGGMAYRQLRSSGENVKYSRIRSPEMLSLFDRSKLLQSIPGALRGLREGIETLKKGDPLATRIKKGKITKESSLEELIYAKAAVDEHGIDSPELAKFMDLSDFNQDGDDLRMAMLNAKYERYVELRGSDEAMDVAGLEVDTDYAMQLVMPSASDFDRYSIGLDWFESLRKQGVKTLSDRSLQESLIDFGEVASMLTTPKTAEALADRMDELFGNVFELDVVGRLGAENQMREPITIIGSKLGSGSNDNWHVNWSDQADVIRVVNEDRINRFYQDVQSNGEYTEHLAELVRTSEEGRALIDQIKAGVPQVSTGQGSRPFLKEAGGILPWSLDHKQRGVTSASAASSFNDMVQRRMDMIARREVENKSKLMHELLKVGNEGSKLRYLDFASSMMRGWEIEVDALVKPDNGMLRLAADSEHNKIIAKQAGLDEVPEYLPSTLANDGVSPVVLDELSIGALQEANRFSDIDFFGNTALMRWAGKGELPYRVGHIPAPSRYGQEMVFLQDASGKVVDFELGVSRKAARNALDARRKERPNSEFYQIITKDTVEDWHDANQRAWNDKSLDISDAWAKTANRQAEGGRTGVILSDDFITGQVQTVYDMYQMQGKRFIANTFRGELEQLQAMSDAAMIDQRGSFRDPVTNKAADSFKNEFENYVGQLLGNAPRAEGSAVSAFNRTVDGFFDSVIRGAQTQLFEFRGGRSGIAQTRAGKLEAGFKALADDYGFEPGQAALDAVKREFGGDKTLSSQDVSRKIAQTVTWLALRLVEPAHVLLTTASIFTTTPHVAAFYRRKSGEGINAYKQRVGMAGTIVGDGEGLVPDVGKLTMATMQKFFRGDYADVIKEAEEDGYLTAHVAEFMNSMSGNVSKTKSMQMLNDAAGYLTRPTQWAEDFSRKMSFLVGYEMFNQVGQQGRKISLAAANDFANKAIADYRPGQRSELFQGAAGIQLGLFQTFALNYLQRLGVALENKQAGALLTQVGTQGFMFGAGSLPGWSIVNDYLLSTWDHTARPEDNFSQMEADGFADIMLYGTLANLPKMLGFEHGLSLYTRGEIQTPRVVTAMNWSETPGFTMAQRFYQMAGEGMRAVAQEGGLAEQKFYESMVLAMPHRPTRGMMELFGLGYAPNKYGDVVSGDEEEFRGFIGMTSRIMGLRPMMENKRANAMWRDTQMKLAQRKKMEALRESVKAAMRTNGGIDPTQIAQILESYVAYGGKPANLRGFLKRAAIKSEKSAYALRLEQMLRSGERGRELMNFVESVDDAYLDRDM